GDAARRVSRRRRRPRRDRSRMAPLDRARARSRPRDRDRPSVSGNARRARARPACAARERRAARLACRALRPARGSRAMTQRPRAARESSRLSGLARSMTEVEWLMLALVVLYAFVTDAEAARSPGVVAALLGFAAFVLVFRFIRPLARHARLELVAEIAAMLVFLTVLLAQLGGLMSPLTSLYLLPIVAAALTLGR